MVIGLFCSGFAVWIVAEVSESTLSILKLEVWRVMAVPVAVLASTLIVKLSPYLEEARPVIGLSPSWGLLIVKVSPVERPFCRMVAVISVICGVSPSEGSR